MKNTQLRTGNLVTHKGNISTIDAVLRGHVSLKEDVYVENGQEMYGDWVDLDEIEFIPVTKEWLARLGLISDGKHILFELPQHIREKCKPDGGYKASAFFFNNREDLKKWMDCQTRVCVEYVHQVQNLVFALTGEELTIE